MASYWYSTDGMDHKRLSNRHLAVLDRAFERRARVEIYDEAAFGTGLTAVADPYLGTMTAGDIHYGLYRNPSLRVRRSESSSSLDTFIFMESTTGILSADNRCSSKNSWCENNQVLVASDRRTREASNRQCGDNGNNSSAARATSNPRKNCSFMSAAAAQSSSPTLGARRTGSQPALEEDCICCIIS